MPSRRRTRTVPPLRIDRRSHDLIEADRRVAALTSELHKACAARNAIAMRDVRDNLPADHADADVDSLVAGRAHACGTSPTACCVYDDANDPCHDGCLYCGEPYERK